MEESKIDTIRFGFKVGKTDGEIFRESSPKEIKDICDEYKLIIARVNLDDIDLINKLEDIGFRIKDTQITYQHNLNNFNNKVIFNTSVTIRDFKK